MAEANSPDEACSSAGSDVEPFVPTEEIKKIHADFVAEIRKRELSSSENFDKSILTFSSAGLALSVGFLKDFIPIQLACAGWALYASWVLFTVATCSTMASFLASSKALSEHESFGYRYYMEGDENAFSQKSHWNGITVRLNYLSGASFLIAMILTVFFISMNLEKGSLLKMSSQRTTDGITAPSLQSRPGPLQRGITAPPLQKIPSAPASSPASSPAAAPAPAPAEPAKSR